MTDSTVSTVAFLAPIVLNNELRLKCHRAPGQDIPFENVALIQQLYPAGRGDRFQTGRPAWGVAD